MKRQSDLIGLAVVLLMTGMQVRGHAGPVAGEPPDWWKAQRDVVSTLMEGRTDFADLAMKMSDLKPKNAQEGLFKLNVFMRGGMTPEALAALRELKALCPDLPSSETGNIYYTACDQFSSWDLARAVVETFADGISGIALENRLLKHLLSSGWTVEQVDRWLADRPPGRNHFWVKERLRFSTIHGRGEKLTQQLMDGVRRNPKDIGGAVGLLEALIYARHTGREKWDLAWMAQTVRPERATEADNIASRLGTLKDWKTALVFHRKAVETSLTDAEARQLAWSCSAFVPAETLRAAFRARSRERMAQCFLELGRNAEAQEWMVQAADIREKYKLGRNALLAGRVQGASGQRVIEGRIKKEEKKSENDPAYWRERAAYYRGRKEPDQEEAALKKGLALTTAQPGPASDRRGHISWRSSLLSDYARFLKREKRADQAVALLRKEMEQAPADSISAERAANRLAFDFARHLSADDGVLWGWLANRPKWEHTEQRLLWRMLKAAKPGDLDRHFSRAEELAAQAHPSRSYTLGWIMNRMRFAKRSIPLLEHAAENAADEELKQRAAFALFESCLDTGDWRGAERIFPQARERLTPREVTEWYAKIAAAAAGAGAKADAMRIWRAVANVNPAEMRRLDALAKAGLRDDLVSFYREMEKKLPSSGIPAAALKALEVK